MSPLFSLIVPTRGRPEEFRRLLTSLIATTDRPESIEVIAVVDADDSASMQVDCDRLHLKRVIVAPGRPMGALNMAGYDAAAGRYLMLLNDDVVARTPGWDTKVATCFAAFPDEILLVHISDTVFQKALCTFPIVSRAYCKLAGGICPREYSRYRIDDHIEDVFNLLGVLGERRTLYLPSVIFEHLNHVTNDQGVRQYFSEPGALALDALLFDRLCAQRKELALQARIHICANANTKQIARWRAQLTKVSDPFLLRTPERLRVITDEDLAHPALIARRETWWHELRKRIKKRVRESGYRGLARAVAKRVLGKLGARI